MSTLETKQFNFLSALTGAVVLIFAVGITGAMFMGKIEVRDYMAALGAPVALLIGLRKGGGNGSP